LTDIAELSIADISDRLVEVGVIQDVVEADPRNELLSLSPAFDGNAFEDAQIRVLIAARFRLFR
jgi:hypothetical protein